ncbi:MAG: hypothetical protein WCC64_02045 [Aliidongia sp.]
MSRQFLLSLLGVLGVVLVAIIGFEIFATSSDTAIEAAPAALAAAPAGRVAAMPRPAEWAATSLARPLFSLMRRPEAEKTKDVAAGPDQPTNDLPRLAGIQLVGANKHAIFQPTGDVPPLVVAEGDTLKDSVWKVETIGLTSVTLSGPSGETTVEPKFDENAVAPPPQLPVQRPRLPQRGAVVPTPQPAPPTLRPNPAPNAVQPQPPPVPGQPSTSLRFPLVPRTAQQQPAPTTPPGAR